MLTAASVSDVMQLQSAFARERFDALMAYSKEMQEMVSKAGAEASEPAKAMFEKAMSYSKAA
jgi:phasin family protein